MYNCGRGVLNKTKLANGLNNSKNTRDIIETFKNNFYDWRGITHENGKYEILLGLEIRRAAEFKYLLEDP
jgi:GH24 family phage-related lysozyme (muramidase)